MGIPNKKATLILGLLFTYLLNAQNTFSKKIHYGVHDNLAQYIGLYNDTFYIPAMVANHPQPSTFSASLLKLDINGNILPQTFYTQTGVSIFPTTCYYKSVTGKFYVNATISHGYDVQSALVIFNKAGDTLAIKSFGDTAYYNYMFWILPKKNDPNKLLIFGSSDSLCGTGHTGPYCHPIIRVTDTLGNLLYTRNYMTGGLQREVTNADTTAEKGYIFSGFEQQNSDGSGQAYVVKLDSNLNQVWQNYYFSCGTIFPSIHTLKTGTYIHGYASVDSIFQGWAYYSRIALAKINNNGTILWHKEYGSLQRDVDAYSIKELSNGDLIVCGCVDVPTGNPNYPSQLCGYLLRTDSMGNEKWLQTYKITNPNDLAGQNYLYDVITMPDAGFTAIGYVATTDTAAQLTWVLRVDSMGCLTPGCNPATTGIKQFTDSNEQITVYPNPAQNNLQITVRNEKIREVTIYDVLGKQVKNEILEIKRNTTQIDVSDYSNGIYFIQIKTKDNILVEKFIKE